MCSYLKTKWDDRFACKLYTRSIFLLVYYGGRMIPYLKKDCYSILGSIGQCVTEVMTPNQNCTEFYNFVSILVQLDYRFNIFLTQHQTIWNVIVTNSWPHDTDINDISCVCDPIAMKRMWCFERCKFYVSFEGRSPDQHLSDVVFYRSNDRPRPLLGGW